MKKSVVLLFVFAFSLSYSQINYQKSSTGLQFYMAKDVPGSTAKMGQLVSMNMSIKDANGNFIKNTFKDPKPMLFPVKLSLYDGDIYEAVGLLSKGDSALFLTSADSMYAKIFRSEMPEKLKKGSMLFITIKVYDIWNQKDRIEKLKVHADTVISTSEKIRREKEDIQIQKYIKNKGFAFNKTPKGVYYTYYSKGKGLVESKNGNVVLINFVGKLLDDTSFETTFNEDEIGRPISFVLGKGEVIPGWDDLLISKREGDKILCIVPSHLAFGSQPKGSKLAANTTLVFDLDVVGVR